MRFFTLHERPGKAGGDTDLLAVKTGFSWWAAVLPPLWLLRHRLWLGLLAYMIFSTAFGIALELGDIADPAASAIGIAFSLLIGAMAHDYRRWTLRRHGWRMVGVLRAADAEEAELRHLHDGRHAIVPAAAPAYMAEAYPMRGSTDAFPVYCHDAVIVMKLALIDYGSGNLRSAAKAIQRAADENAIALDLRVTAKTEDVVAADAIVLPGVGAFADCYRGLNALDGMIEALNEQVIRKAKPFFGICVGMQLMATVGREHGEHKGLGWIDGAVELLKPADASLKVPHMGWNQLNLRQPHPVLAGLETGTHAYFVHSYHMIPADRAVVLADAAYGGPVLAMLGRDNMVGTQFHPEKSQATGLRLLANFLRWRP